jgi:TolA-binding protein
MLTRPWIAGLTLCSLFLAIGCSSEDKLKQVENEVGDLKLEVFKLRSQMEESNRKAEEDRAANGEARNQDRRFQADLQETMRQLQDSTRILSNRLGEAVSRPARVPARPAAPTAEAAPSVTDDEKAFNAALLDYNRGNYALAAEGLDLFLKANPQSARRPDALFYMGLCWFNQKDFEKARTTFESIIREYSSSSQFLPAKLKRAQCLHRMGLKPAAIKAYKELAEGLRGTPEARTAQQELNDLGF